MLTGLKVPSWPRKCAFYRPEPIVTVGTHGTEF